jgi:hypothetical protein
VTRKTSQSLHLIQHRISLQREMTHRILFQRERTTILRELCNLALVIVIVNVLMTHQSGAAMLMLCNVYNH